MKIDAIRRYIQQEILEDDSLSIEPDDDLILSGILDSASVMQLISHIEESEAIEIAPKDMVPENFGSLSRIHAFLAGYGADT